MQPCNDQCNGARPFYTTARGSCNGARRNCTETAIFRRTAGNKIRRVAFIQENAFIMGLLDFFKKRNMLEGGATHVTITFNARWQPEFQEQVETRIDDLLRSSNLGEVDGSGWLNDGNGEALEFDVEVQFKESDERNIERLKELLSAVVVPKGSKIQKDSANDKDGYKFICEIGDQEGLGIYLNGTDLPDEVYSQCDINVLLDRLFESLKGKAVFGGWWQGNRETALYFYGKEYEYMVNSIESVIDNYPLCQQCRLVKIA